VAGRNKTGLSGLEIRVWGDSLECSHVNDVRLPCNTQYTQKVAFEQHHHHSPPRR
jgi:hypothetical protein